MNHKDTKTQRCTKTGQTSFVSLCLCGSLTLRKREDRQDTTLVTEIPHVSERANSSKRGGRIFAADITSHTATGPATNAREHRDVLLSIRSGVRHRIADDS